MMLACTDIERINPAGQSLALFAVLRFLSLFTFATSVFLDIDIVLLL